MQDNRLFINGVEMQLSDRSKIGVTLQANNLGELQTRQGSYTNTFRLPLNAFNKAKLEQAQAMTSASQLPYQKLKIDYFEGVFNVMPDAIGTIKYSDKDWIYIDANGGNVSLFKLIGDKTIGELFKNESTHFWTFNNVLNSRDSSQYYIYPLIDWRVDEDTFFNSPTVNPSKILPCCREQSIFEQVEALTGYTFTGSYINSNEHKSGVITPNELTLNDEFADDVDVKATFPIVTPSEIEVLEGSGYIAPVNVAVTMALNEPGFINGSYYPAVNEAGQLRFKGKFASRRIYINGGLGILGTPQVREHWFTVQIKEAGTVLAETTYPHFVGTIYDLDSFQETVFDVQTGEIVLTAGVQYYVNIIAHAEKHSNADTQIEFGFSANVGSFIKSPKAAIIYGNEIRFTDLFRMKTTDVMKDILNLRAILIQTNEYSKEVSFNYFDDLIKNKQIALDWSHLVDVRESQLFYKFGNYGQRNNFLFKENDQVSAGLGDWYFNINNETLEAEIDAVQLNHSATEQLPKYQGRVVPEIDGIDTDLNKWNAPGWRILQLETQPTSYNVTYDDGTTSQAINTNVPFCRFVGFEELVPEYYEALTGILDNTKVLPLVLKLSPDLIHNLDHIIPISLDVPELNISGYFYINVIKSYQGGATLVEFVRL